MREIKGISDFNWSTLATFQDHMRTLKIATHPYQKTIIKSLGVRPLYVLKARKAEKLCIPWFLNPKEPPSSPKKYHKDF